jgi:cation transport ATPase
MKPRSHPRLNSHTAASIVVTQLVARRRQELARLGLAWLAMMQVMMFALPGYLRHEAGGQDSLEVLDWAIVLMNWASLTLTIPVILYSAWPVWLGCAHAYSSKRITMDVPVGLSLLAAFIPSVWAALKASGDVYFDSITMFVAFLLTARFVEQRASRAQGCASTQTSLKNPRASSGGGAGSQESLVSFGVSLLAQANRVATVFVMIQLMLVAVLGAVWWVIEPAQAWCVLVSLLVMSCPCALSLAAPVSLAVLHRHLALVEPLPAQVREALLLRTLRVTRQNLYGALAWHVLTMPLAAIGWVTPWLAALSMLLSSVAVVLNACRLSRSRQTVLSLSIKALAQNQPLQT